MNILLLYPEFPDTFWSFKYALKFVHKRAVLPPLGLLTVAAMLPAEWKVRLVDTNERRLTEKDLAWADCVFISAMIVQRESAHAIIHRCKKAGLRVVAGGPLFSDASERTVAADHFVLNEAELTLPAFLKDLAKGTPLPVYSADGFADIRQSPVPRWDLLALDRYANMSVQFSRGCPHSCDFCNVTSLLGHQVRNKTSAQIIAELDALYARGWRERVFFVDDNFIGNKVFLKNDLLPTLIEWRKGKKGIFFYTQTTILLAGDKTLMDLMVKAGFDKVFVGIETPDAESLAECNKAQNRNRNLLEDVKTIQNAGLEVQAGFIVGFDHDQASVFQRQIDFIQKSGIVTAMVGILQAFPGTRLYERLNKEGRILSASTGDNSGGVTNIVPRMDLKLLTEGHRHILRNLYRPKPYYRRVETFLREYDPPRTRKPVRFQDILALIRCLTQFGIWSRSRFHFWKLMIRTQLRRPDLIPTAVTLAIYGHHFRKTYRVV